ncbi:uncharacterized protein [Lolium perenne]|uniref:uncharacterized protein n=1 Tax=Lolium perenne TaxID=4522 RepID=UPI0021F58D92|nr:uncharacterized protein LOC127344885 [Lolium perenne]
MGHPTVHFDVPTAAGRQIVSVRCCGRDEEAIVSPLRGSSRDQLAAARSDPGPVIVVFVDRDGKYFTDYGFPSLPISNINLLMLSVLSSLSRLEEMQVGGTASVQTLQPPDVLSLNELFHTASLEESPTSISPCSMRVRVFSDWGIRFYIRTDHSGFYHTYPDVGGQFPSLTEAYSAIDCYLGDRQDPTMRIDPYDPDLVYRVNESTREKIIRNILYWPDGTRKLRLQSLPVDEMRSWMLQLVRALVDKYNDDHNLLGDLAYELKGVVSYHVFNQSGSRRMYYHINFTTKTKDNNDLLFFAETMRERDLLVVSCICRVNPFDKDLGYCYRCLSEVKHPKDDAYVGGHSCLPGTYHSYGPREDVGVTADQLETEEAQVRYSYKDPVDPSFLEKLRAPTEVNYPPLRPVEETLAFISSFCR